MTYDPIMNVKSEKELNALLRAEKFDAELAVAERLMKSPDKHIVRAGTLKYASLTGQWGELPEIDMIGDHRGSN